MNRTGLPMAASPLYAEYFFIIACAAPPVKSAVGAQFALFAGFVCQMRANFVKITPCQTFLGSAIIRMFLFQTTALHVVQKIELHQYIAGRMGRQFLADTPARLLAANPSHPCAAARGAFVFPGQAPCGGAVPGFLFFAKAGKPRFEYVVYLF